MMPAEPEHTSGTEPMADVPPSPPPPEDHGSRWFHKVWAVLLVTFCLEIGLFLLVFPWTEAWDNNYFANSIARIRQVWDNMYLRGAVSGLGLVNLYICAAEALRLRRFAKK